jgi:GNAT superfamily N-acetyltransferase
VGGDPLAAVAAPSPTPLVTPAPVRPMDPSEVPEAAAMLARGFAEEPGNVALFPDPDTRRVMFETTAHQILPTVLRYGTAHVAEVGDELAAIALWHPPGVSTTSLTVAVRSAVAKLSRPRLMASAVPHAASVVLRELPEAVALTRARQRAVRRASQGPTWHLAVLATAPEHRGKGLARALLDRQLRRCDEDGAVAWLETTDPVNPPIYERFGFDIVAHITDAAWLPGFWVMRRAPRRL